MREMVATQAPLSPLRYRFVRTRCGSLTQLNGHWHLKLPESLWTGSRQENDDSADSVTLWSNGESESDGYEHGINGGVEAGLCLDLSWAYTSGESGDEVLLDIIKETT